MSRSRKPPLDPRIAAAQDRAERALAAYERSYVRLKRSFTALEKARKTRLRALRLIDRLSIELEAKTAS